MMQRRGGGIDARQSTMAGFFHSEARHLSVLRLEINGQQPWFCESAQDDQRGVLFTHIHPEFAQLGGGGSGQARDERSRDANGLPHRALEIESVFHVRPNRLVVSATFNNRWFEPIAFEARWLVEADFADLFTVFTAASQPAGRTPRVYTRDGLRLENASGDYATIIDMDGDATWRVEADGKLVSAVYLARGASSRMTLSVRPLGALGMTDADAGDRENAWLSWRRRLARITTPGHDIAQRVITRHVEDFASLPLLRGERDEWLTMQAGIPMYPALFGRDALT
ncbi:MAG: glycogen debranching N-terminal domain-containing protein, partial [Gemmatimonadota bacterium]